MKRFNDFDITVQNLQNSKRSKRISKQHRPKLSTNCFDFIMYDDQIIDEYLLKDKDNIVITLVHKSGHEESICTTSQLIKNQLNNDKQNFYDCVSINLPKYTDELFTQITFKNLNVIVPREFLRLIIKEFGNQFDAFEIRKQIFVWPTNLSLKKTITKEAFRREMNSWVGASHCQNGTSRNVYNIGLEAHRDFFDINHFYRIAVKHDYRILSRRSSLYHYSRSVS